MAAPRPTPTTLKLLRGNPGNRPINKDEPKPEVVLKECPKCFKGVERDFWKNTAATLHKMKVLTEADYSALEIMTRIWSRMFDLRKDIEKNGLVMDVPNVNGDVLRRANPAVGLLQKDESTLKSYMIEFGLTPAARSKLITIKDDDNSSSPLGKYGVK